MNKTAVNSNKSRLIIGFIWLIIVFISVILIMVLPDKSPTSIDAQNNIKFEKNGTAILSSIHGKVLSTFDIEIADTPDKVKTGLMYRDSLQLNQGMLFVFPEAQERSFWMKNTYLPLDIIFIGADSLILSIANNAEPFSEQSIDSHGAAKFVLEVNAGIANRVGLSKGDRIQWKKDYVR